MLLAALFSNIIIITAISIVIKYMGHILSFFFFDWMKLIYFRIIKKKLKLSILLFSLSSSYLLELSLSEYFFRISITKLYKTSFEIMSRFLSYGVSWVIQSMGLAF